MATDQSDRQPPGKAEGVAVITAAAHDQQRGTEGYKTRLCNRSPHSSIGHAIKADAPRESRRSPATCLSRLKSTCLQRRQRTSAARTQRAALSPPATPTILRRSNLMVCMSTRDMHVVHVPLAVMSTVCPRPVAQRVARHNVRHNGTDRACTRAQLLSRISAVRGSCTHPAL